MFSYFVKNKNQKELFFQIKNEFLKESDNIMGWYVIFKDDICLYVGQSKNIPSRLSTHLSGKYSNCDEIIVFLNNDDDDSKLVITEKYLMNIFKPIENVLINFSDDISVEDIADCKLFNSGDKYLSAKNIKEYNDFYILNDTYDLFISSNIELDFYSSDKLSIFLNNQLNFSKNVKKDKK